MARASVRPRPAPPVSELREGSPLVNGSCIRAISASLACAKRVSSEGLDGPVAATVAGVVGTPTGTVSFFDGETLLSDPPRRAVTTEHMTGTVLFLASSDSDFITGQTILVNGGAA